MIFFKARYKKGSTTGQTLVSHLDDVSAYSKLFAETINLSKFAALAGLLHDLGKGCRSWQKYLDNQVKLGKTSNKEDHATAGGQFLYKRIMQNPVAGAELVGQLLAACVMYHHGPGLPDVIKPDGTAQLHERLLKDTEETRLEEAVANIDPVIKQKLDDILQDKDFVPETIKTLGKLIKIRNDKTNRFFNLGFTARLLASCLIDADRLDSAYYERGIPCILENATKKINWEPLLISLENHLAGLPNRGKINEIRRDISAHCAEYGLKENGIYTLSAATGAGKTLASLRYALTHAKEYDKERIFIIAPYTSILDQNADEIRNILDPKGKNGEIILEHHSNLDRSEESEYYVDSTETWNVPIIITTMVQFLEVLFGSGTRKIRRMHRLTNSVIIFDEIQTLPVSCTYLFTWALEYLCQNAGVSALLCTATQPGLDRLKSEYALRLNASNEIVPSIVQHFTDLKRVELVDETKLGGWTLDEVASFIEKLPEQSVLTVVNTKKQARTLYAALSKAHPEWNVVHLSADMCPAHRRKYIGGTKDKKHKGKLQEFIDDKTKKCVCVSTRLIEAGVNIDFDTAIRFFAGLDSIVQTAGRCNRHGILKDQDGNPIIGKTYIINIIRDEEYIDGLQELKHGQRIMERILQDYHANAAHFCNTILHPDLIALYFFYYYGELTDEFLKQKVSVDRKDTMIDLLSTNQDSRAAYCRIAAGKYKERPPVVTDFCQSFESAWKEFEVIAKDTVGVIVPYERGEDIIAALYGCPDIKQTEDLLRDAQQYSVNVYYSGLSRLIDTGVVKKAPAKIGLEIYTVEQGHYDMHIGLSEEFTGLTMWNV